MTEINAYMPITKAKTQLLDMVRSLKTKYDTIAITKNGVPEAVLMSMEAYESLMETVEILADQGAMVILESSAKDVKTGQMVSEEEVFDALQA